MREYLPLGGRIIVWKYFHSNVNGTLTNEVLLSLFIATSKKSCDVYTSCFLFVFFLSASVWFAALLSVMWFSGDLRRLYRDRTSAQPTSHRFNYV